MSIIPLIAGSGFLTFGTNYLISYLKLKAHGQKIAGKVKAIEKYTSTTGTGSDRSTGTFYSPIVEYVFKDQTRTISGSMGSNEIRHKLNQSVTIYVKEGENGRVIAEMGDKSIISFCAIFILVGLIAIGVYYFAIKGSLILSIIVPSVSVAVGYMVSVMAGKHIPSDQEEYKPRDDGILIETQADYMAEISSHSFWGNFIAYALMIASIGIMYFGYSDLPESAKELIISNPGEFWTKMTSGKLSSSWEKPLMIIGIGAFFFLASLRSAYYVRKTYGGMMKL
ncbi:MAG: DUF3592 domain-containing protein [Alphaproteobacteria bacterium]